MENTYKAGMTIAEASQYSGLGQHLLRRLVKGGKLPALFVGSRMVIQRDVIDRFMSANAGVDLLDPDGVRAAGEDGLSL